MSIVVPNTEYDYIILVNHEKLLNILNELFYDNAVLCPPDGLYHNDIEKIKVAGKNVMMLWFETSDRNVDKTKEFIRLSRAGIRTAYLTQWAFLRYRIDEVSSVNIFAKLLSKYSDLIDSTAEEWGVQLCRDYKNRCGNCHCIMPPDAKFCQMCGTRRGEGRFLPYSNPSIAIYGPPYIFHNICPNCGNEWEDTLLGRVQTEYCPRCGTEGQQEIVLPEKDCFVDSFKN